MKEEKEELTLKERWKILPKKSQVEKINTFIMIKRIGNNNKNITKYNNFFQLKTNIFEKHFNNVKKNLKNKQ